MIVRRPASWLGFLLALTALALPVAAQQSPIDSLRQARAKADSARRAAAGPADSLRRARGDTAHDPGDSAVYHSRHPGRIITIDHTPGGDLRSTETVFAPTFFYAPETGFGGGGGLVRSVLLGDHDHEQRPSTLQVSGQVTQEQQLTVYTVGDLWTRHNAYHVTFEVTYSHYPQKFFGVGPQSADYAEVWAPTLERVAASVSRKLHENLYVGVQGLVEHEVVSVRDTGVLLSGAVPGQLGWNVVQLGALAQLDTREPYYFPLKGNLALVSLWYANAAFGSEFAYARASIDLRHYQGLGDGHVFAMQLLMDGVLGTIPFDRMPQIGGMTILRGLWDGRYRDRGMVALQTELRSAAWHRIGATAFASTGSVAASLRDLATRNFRVAGGFGLRFALTDDDRLNIRIDRGWSNGTSGTYFTLGEAF
ncbi:MAG: BamA/TamA family outer membrane protein [Gemmatimonadetes bacterium]|nr:BamA/TamA family outer membrane protein [Gemmatimonadota bacterium]